MARSADRLPAQARNDARRGIHPTHTDVAGEVHVAGSIHRDVYRTVCAGHSRDDARGGVDPPYLVGSLIVGRAGARHNEKVAPGINGDVRR